MNRVVKMIEGSVDAPSIVRIIRFNIKLIKFC
ncbi:unnamed protein product [Arabidopsis thaliana]|uniref:Uncharacterized protein n=4 Tax=Arabidopsis TaxID=3701 RepID=A0A654G6A6_ARATH|nr:uncharacterized protein AT5G39024 [Arabidopsis thaliana]KAG7604257.1 hypothetical protein ISN45_At05g033380 [Arabidopsis thaliana x Arabidopsis arenosa]KAG7611180.1 hypothetical protein ISN44_As05g032890 [Arabidopsis suecica]AED94388.1 hypothetical protein AT5G39024 [Arabidopsis thaliana]CAA0406246.1 unnamed protein product [Arabidopsis thaliana]VYS68675.1 unnamed protein product [Arabidopsis thaliana]|eukprot:NP_001119333.1 hypothetical protein AT5G39024 [Arabidopsis thaliana]